VGGALPIQFPKSEFPRAGPSHGGRRRLPRRSIIPNAIISFNHEVQKADASGLPGSAVRIRTPDPPLQATAAFRVYPRLRPHFHSKPRAPCHRPHVPTPLRPHAVLYSAVASALPQPVAAWLSAAETQKTGQPMNTTLRSHDGARTRKVPIAAPRTGWPRRGRTARGVDRVPRPGHAHPPRRCRPRAVIMTVVNPSGPFRVIICELNTGIVCRRDGTRWLLDSHAEGEQYLEFASGTRRSTSSAFRARHIPS
jgi:hypothetical protein